MVKLYCNNQHFAIYIGENAPENTKLASLSSPYDVWFHDSTNSSAHVYLRIFDAPETLKDLYQKHKEQIEICAWFVKHCQTNHQQRDYIKVNYTFSKNVNGKECKEAGQVNVKGESSYVHVNKPGQGTPKAEQAMLDLAKTMQTIDTQNLRHVDAVYVMKCFLSRRAKQVEETKGDLISEQQFPTIPDSDDSNQQKAGKLTASYPVKGSGKGKGQWSKPIDVEFKPSYPQTQFMEKSVIKPSAPTKTPAQITIDKQVSRFMEISKNRFLDYHLDDNEINHIKKTMEQIFERILPKDVEKILNDQRLIGKISAQATKTAQDIRNLNGVKSMKPVNEDDEVEEEKEETKKKTLKDLEADYTINGKNGVIGYVESDDEDESSYNMHHNVQNTAHGNPTQQGRSSMQQPNFSDQADYDFI